MHIIGGRAPNRVLFKGQQIDVPSAVLTTIVTMPSNGISFVSKIVCSGEENGRWEVYINNVRNATKRTTDRTVEFDFNMPLKILNGEMIDVKVEHFGPGSLSTMEATIFGFPG